MGRTYYAKNETKETFDVNVAGTQILDILHAEINLGYFTMGEIEPYIRKCAKYSYNKKLSLKVANAIKTMNEQQIEKVHKEAGRLFGGDIEEFKTFITQWADFLEKSNGCKAD